MCQIWSKTNFILFEFFLEPPKMDRQNGKKNQFHPIWILGTTENDPNWSQKKQLYPIWIPRTTINGLNWRILQFMENEPKLVKTAKKIR